MSNCRAQQMQSGISASCVRCGASANYGEKLVCRLPEDERLRTMDEKKRREGEVRTVAHVPEDTQ